MSYRKQTNITLNEEQKKFVLDNFGKMNIGEISKMLGLGYNLVHNNLRVMGKVKTKMTKVIKMDGMFDIDSFGKFYKV